uniref:cation:dicarboxylate symporter family transporter n=1 Tax=Exiguobacterium sp. TaxID=44751 RepID=UPI0028AB791E
MKLLKMWNQISLVKQIAIGLIVGIVLAVTIPEVASSLTIFGTLFVSSLKAVAPILVFFLVMASIVQHKKGQQTNMKSIVFLYLLGTFLAGALAVIVS